MTFEIRLARPDEHPAIGGVTIDAYRSDALLHDETDYADELTNAAARARDAELWVAADGTHLLGTVTYCPPGSPYRELAKDGEGEFRMLAVDPAHRRRGVARALVEHCITRSIVTGDERIVICSLREMATAHRLYTDLGFERLPERDWAPVPGVDLLAFSLELAAGR